MAEKKCKILSFHQYNSESPSDELILFYAQAKDLYKWAGIPRKGWQIRSLFQRPITTSRESELKLFWEKAANPDFANNEDFILGPSAIIIAIQDDSVIEDGCINLDYNPPVDLTDADDAKVTQELSLKLIPIMINRLSEDQKQVFDSRVENPFVPFPEINNDYVFEFLLQLQQMSFDADRFFEENCIDDKSKNDIIISLEAILRPAIVVDGQHRLYGAANTSTDINLPVVAIPRCKWMEQIYQFVVINEKAKPIEQSLLTDIFGSSLTRVEQEDLRDKLQRSNVEIESRIAAVIAGRTDESPFNNMVVVKMDGTPPNDIRPYLSERTIRALIDGSTQKYSWGWRTNDQFYTYCVKPTFQNREEWDSWQNGKWKSYWFAFWNAVKDFYNKRCEEEYPDHSPIWSSTMQSNLTKAVTLRQMQTLFMQYYIKEMEKIDDAREVLVDMTGDPVLADQKIKEKRKSMAIPKDVDKFVENVQSIFLENGIPIKVFTANWKTSLDDPQGQTDLWETLETAFLRSKKGEQFRIRGRIFEANES